MRLHKLVIFLLTLVLVGCSTDNKQGSAFEDAQSRAAQKRQAVLIEFTSSNENCGDCSLAQRLFDSDSSLIALKNTMSFCRLDVDSSEGSKLAEMFHIGIRLPVYLITDSNGEEIYRFTGFKATRRFLSKLNRAQNDLTTIKARIKRMQSFPNLDDALFLGLYFSTIEKPSEAVDYYRKADELNSKPNRNFKFEVFNAAANAAWNGEMSFETVEAYADSVLNTEYRYVINAARVTTNMVSLALQTGKTDRLEKYLNLAIDRFAVMSDDNSTRIREGFKADRELFVRHDTARAMAIKRNSFGPAFRRTSDNDYEFAVWCIDRRINLDEAEQIVQELFDSGSLGNRSIADKFYQLAHIEKARGNLEGAVDLTEQAVTIDPMSPIFVKQLEKYRQEL